LASEKKHRDAEGKGEPPVAVGRVVGAHGLRGEVKTVPLNDRPERILEIRSVFLSGEAEILGERFDVEHARRADKLVLLKFRGVDDRNRAETLKGYWLNDPNGEVKPLAENEYYIFDLKGLLAETAEGRAIGRVVDVLKLPAQDALVVDRNGEEILIPMVKELVKRVDVPAGKVVIDFIEGLY
jgi:16S rRNA processing protein RimM